MLLLVMNAECYCLFESAPDFLARALQQLGDVLVDRLPVATRVGDRRPGNQSAEIAAMHVASGVVVRIKQKRVLGYDRFVAGQVGF